MDQLLKERITRRLDNLSNDKAYQVLDYVEFLESKFGSDSGDKLQRLQAGENLLLHLRDEEADQLRVEPASGIPLQLLHSLPVQESGTIGSARDHCHVGFADQ